MRSEASIAFAACFMVFDCESMMRWGRFGEVVPQTTPCEGVGVSFPLPAGT